MDERIFLIDGEVRGQMRPRATTRGRHAGMYKAAKDRDWEARILSAYKADWDGLDPIRGAFMCAIIARIEPPKSISKKKRAEMIENEYPLRKPDVDNIAKSVLDALNGVAFEDDKNCVSLLVKKIYNGIPGLYVSLRGVDE